LRKLLWMARLVYSGVESGSREGSPLPPAFLSIFSWILARAPVNGVGGDSEFKLELELKLVLSPKVVVLYLIVSLSSLFLSGVAKFVL